MELTYTEFYIYFFFAQIVFGALIGFVPLFLGKKKNRDRLGKYGFLACVIGGAISPLIGLIVMCVFIWLILKKGQTDSAFHAADNADREPS